MLDQSAFLRGQRPLSFRRGKAMGNIGWICQSILAAGLMTAAGSSAKAADQTWDGGTTVSGSNGAGSAWLTGTNWLNDPTNANVPGSASTTTNTDIATFQANGTSSNIGINFNTTGGTYYLGALNLTAGIARNIGNSSGTAGTLTLNGGTVPNVILRNTNSNLLTIQQIQSGNAAMDVALGNATNNIVSIESTGGITISSVIKSGTGTNLTVQGSGSGVLRLTGANTFTGTTTIATISGGGGTLTAAAATGQSLGATTQVTVNTGGTLLIGTSDQVNNTAPVTLSGGTIARGTGASEGSASTAGFGALTLSSNSTLDFGNFADVGTLTFASFAPTGFLAINNWTGLANTQGTVSTDRLIFNQSQSGNLSNFNFAGYAPGAVQFDLNNGFFEVTPQFTAVPEPSTAAVSLLLVGFAAYQKRRRLWSAAEQLVGRIRPHRG